MKQENDNVFDGLDLLLKKRNGPCLSMVLQFYREPAMRKHNQDIFKDAIAKAALLLDAYKCAPDDKKIITTELEKFALNFDPTKCGQGLGIFIAKGVARLVFFPFAVNEIVLIADSFEIRDVLFLHQQLRPYHVLLLSSKVIRLFMAQGPSLTEIKDNAFPMMYEEHVQSGGGRLHSSQIADAGGEKYRGMHPKRRFNEFVKLAHARLLKYKRQAGETFVLAGPSDLIRHFHNEYLSKMSSTSLVVGNFEGKDHATLGRASWKACKTMREAEIKQNIERLNDIGLRYKAKGIRKVWEAAIKGKGLLLLVERDFRRPAYVPSGTQEIRLRMPRGKHKFIADAVDDVIEKVLAAKGKVLITEPRQLGKFENIGMMLRY